MLLNKIPVLDKGYVALLNAANTQHKLNEIKDTLLPNALDTDKLKVLSSMTILIKCPIFVQTHLSQYGLNILHMQPQGDTEAYIPNVGEISASDLNTSGIIADDIYRTTEALLINPKAYQSDGCDRFTSHVIMPISTYTVLIVHGGVTLWSAFLNQNKLPSAIESYRAAVQQIYSAEWR